MGMRSVSRSIVLFFSPDMRLSRHGYVEVFFFFQAEDGIRDLVRSRGLGDVYKRQVEENLETEFFAAPPNGRIDYLKEIVDDPYVLFGVSDGGAHTKFLTAGRYPTETLVKIVREHAMISLEEAHWRLSALPAQFAGFEGRGVLRKGAPADILVYDYENLEVLPAEIVHDLPAGEWRRVQRASGYRYVLVNGEVTIRDDEPTNVHSGRLLRFGTGLPQTDSAIAAE
eukprot:TRINITY_DN27700_c0_g1_i1.p1 TRINITY_DN27700_c0_g1~~TRINITY_DN27700_c0_g1_i1.p1  ORF type:complete len:226 (+),score=47.43 TRINITY_DN27700_c0_g1_i1:2-679(+)